MAASGKKLGKLSLAILENFVEGTLGKKFVEELRAPTDQTLAIQTALEHTEAIFRRYFDDQDLARAIFIDLPIDRARLGAVIVNFFKHPTDPDFSQNLESLLTSEFKNLARERIKRQLSFLSRHSSRNWRWQILAFARRSGCYRIWRRSPLSRKLKNN